MARKRTHTRVAWYKVYLALTAFSTGLLGLVLYDVPPFGGLTPVAVSALIVALFAVASVGYWYDVSRGRRSEETPPNFLRTLDEEVDYREEEDRGEESEEGNGDGRGPNDADGSNPDGGETDGDADESNPDANQTDGD
ncbi:hypothetical protein [Halorussus sp. MSC15.2]|uniref:hypothetical protein n=1 Tax=Halorussus sp. MSC15.2 TaxID=2283638 RepID=UPI0013D728D6|nr:hypothetical protein [Halorussus sp. MSC15.2]NEU56373.1 hypothetical protein [Halorussus sp. MSC15.2]